MGFNLLVKKKNEREKRRGNKQRRKQPQKLIQKLKMLEATNNRILDYFTALKWIVLCYVLIVDELYMLM